MLKKMFILSNFQENYRNIRHFSALWINVYAKILGQNQEVSFAYILEEGIKFIPG
jgi:hypothetical protein